jgi:hypothetical protein
MKNIPTFEDFLNEGMEYWPDTILKKGIKPGMTLVTYHGSPNQRLVVSSKPIHVGTSEQTDTRIESIWDNHPVFYEHEINIKLTNPCPKILKDVDGGVGHETDDFTKYGDYNEFVYHNTVEGYPNEKNNLSIFIIDFKQSYITSKIKATIYTS